ncbi:archease [bacterium]|nr:archease [bacterium]
MGNYHLINHTADIGIFVEGKDLKDLFSTAAYAMFSQMFDLDKLEEKETKRIKLEAENLEDLLIRWLNELLFLSDSGYIFKQFNIENLQTRPNNGGQATFLSASVNGEKIDFRKKPFKQQIKAATYHQLEIKKADSGNLQATIIFDV